MTHAARVATAHTMVCAMRLRLVGMAVLVVPMAMAAAGAMLLRVGGMPTLFAYVGRGVVEDIAVGVRVPC